MTRLFPLSPREIDVARLIGAGKSRAQISEELGIHPWNFDTIRRNIRRKVAPRVTGRKFVDVCRNLPEVVA